MHHMPKAKIHTKGERMVRLCAIAELVQQFGQIIIIIHFFRNLLLLQSINTKKLAQHDPIVGLASPLTGYMVRVSRLSNILVI